MSHPLPITPVASVLLSFSRWFLVGLVKPEELGRIWGAESYRLATHLPRPRGRGRVRCFPFCENSAARINSAASIWWKAGSPCGKTQALSELVQFTEISGMHSFPQCTHPIAIRNGLMSIDPSRILLHVSFRCSAMFCFSLSSLAQLFFSSDLLPVCFLLFFLICFMSVVSAAPPALPSVFQHSVFFPCSHS